MRKQRIAWGVIALVVVVAGIVSACRGAEQEPTAEQAVVEGEVLLEERCTECHGLERATTAEKTRAAWEETVSRMIDKGAELNDEETTILVEYLAGNYGP